MRTTYICPADDSSMEHNVFDHRTQLTRIATVTSQSYQHVTPTVPNKIETENGLARIDTKDSLDPDSPNFNVYKWARTTMEAFDKAGVKLRQASFSFKNLSVSGSSSTAHFQSTVVSIFMIPFRIKEHFSLGRLPETKILRHCDGVVKPGEMLLVLGCPGSGCSTFLKTMAGDLDGLQVDKSSDIHYNGMI